MRLSTVQKTLAHIVIRQRLHAVLALGCMLGFLAVRVQAAGDDVERYARLMHVSLPLLDVRDTVEGEPELPEVVDEDSSSSEEADLDSLETMDSISTDTTVVEEPMPPWSAQVRGVLSTFKQRAGVDISGSSVTLDGGARISHRSGLSLDVVTTRRPGSNVQFQQTAFSLGYAVSLSDEYDFSVDGTLYRYPNDSVNAFAQSPASLSMAVDWTGEEWDAGFGIDRFIGTNSFTYVNFSAGRTFYAGSAVSLPDDDLFISPSLGVTAAKTTSARKNKATGSFGLSSIMFDVFVNARLSQSISLFIDPGVLLTYQRDLLKVLRGNAASASKATQFLLSIGIRWDLPL